MSTRNVEAIHGVYERWGGGDFRVRPDLFDPLVVLVMRPEFPDAGTYIGPEAIAEYTRSFLEPWTRITIEAEEVVVAGDSVVVAVRQRGVGAGSGIETELRYCHLWSFRGSKVIRIETFRERAQAFEAAGLERA